MFAASRRLWSWSSRHPLGYLTLACWASSTWLLSSVVIFLVIFLLQERDQPWKNKAMRSWAVLLTAQDDTGSYKPEEGPAEQEAVISPSDRAREIRSHFLLDLNRRQETSPRTAGTTSGQPRWLGRSWEIWETSQGKSIVRFLTSLHTLFGLQTFRFHFGKSPQNTSIT